MATIFDTVSIIGKRKTHFDQLLVYLEAYEDSGCYYGNKDQFNKRHTEIKEWLESIVNMAGDSNYRIPLGNRRMEIEQKVKNIFFKQLDGYFGKYDVKKPEDIPNDATFSAMHIDSLDHFEIVMAIEEEFDKEIPDTICDKWKTVRDVIDYMKHS